MAKEILDPLYGFIGLSDAGLCILDSIEFQRLRHIKQLGLTYLVFPSAQHTRFEHALGVFYLTEKLLNKLGTPKDRKLRDIVRIGGLLHDIGHPPFSHTTEVLLPESKNHEDFTAKIILDTELYPILKREFEFTHEDIELLVRITTGETTNPEENFLSSFITGQFGADRMDYLRRDAYFCGVSYGFFEYNRLIQTLSVEEDRDRKLIVVEQGGISALESFLVGRYFMYSQVYFHRVVRILNLHLIDFIKKVALYEDIKKIDTYIRYNDSVLLSKLFMDKKFSLDMERIFGRKHFREVLLTENQEEFEHAKEVLLNRFDPSLLKFDTVFKKPYDDTIYVRTKEGSLKRIEEISSLVSSLKPIRIYSIYVDPSIREEACSLLRE